ncbi:protein PSK SIMULATOR 1-like isoform X1 [Prosopis cineraria]|uniref:protein PSK SIMULATOR 1-like isoform X1 n=1 Tax=Prosopis cineraria TaxID=364024 RepID=UPI0024102EAF|nr:protein PSK SIMULATOR 1-like isoform X1 [Prosopis cineraria]
MTCVKVPFVLWLSEAMGAFCSRSGNDDKVPVQRDDHSELNKSNEDARSSMPSELATSPQSVENLQEPTENRGINAETSPYELYDGIPRFADSFLLKSLSVRSRQKVSEVSSRLGRAGTIGIGKAVEVLDTLGSSMTSLNAGTGFTSGASTKGNEIGILAFEVANTIVKGFNLMQSLSDENIKHLKEELFLSKAVKDLVSKDMDELLKIVAADKRQELKIFSDEVVRFGNRSKDPQWHNMDRYFEKISEEHNSQREPNDEAESIMQQLMTLVHFTAELYHELHALGRSEQDSLRKHLEEQKSGASQRGDKYAISRAGLKSQKKQVKHLKKKSLWSCSLEEIMEKLVDIVLFLHLEINNAFGTAVDHKPAIGYVSNHQRLGPAGLALHYANIVLQIDTLVANSSSMPENTRDGLYQSLPPNMKLALRSKLPSVHVAEDRTVEDIKEEIEKTLHWLVPVATNTAKAHHGFGWVGEWASAGSETNLKTAQTSAMRIETFHHADKNKVEKYILELLLWLQRLAIQSGAGVDVGGVRSTTKSTHLAPLQKKRQQPRTANTPYLTISEQNLVQLVSKKVWIKGMSKSWDFDRMEARLRENSRLTKSWSLSSSRSIDISFNRISSKLPVIDFGADKERALDVIDRVGVVR